MYGGLGHRKFYRNEVIKYESEWRKKFPPNSYTSEEMQAGFDKLAKAVGFYGTILFMEKETPYNRDELERWEIVKFKTNLWYIAWQNFTQKKYSEIIKKKK